MLNSRAGHYDWVKHGNRRGGPSPANANDDIFDNRRRFLGGIFIRDSRSWLLTDGAESDVLSTIVSL